MKHTITLDVDNFKAILLDSWHLLLVENQRELRDIGLDPDTTGEK